jgi:hypothetical protein
MAVKVILTNSPDGELFIRVLRLISLLLEDFNAYGNEDVVGNKEVQKYIVNLKNRLENLE